MALGTFVAIEAQAPTETAMQSGIAAAFAAVARVERLMHPSREGSDLARLNRAAARLPAAAADPVGVHESIHVDEWTWQVLALCQRLHRLSDGVFDPCLPGASEHSAEAHGRFGDLDLVAPHGVIPHARMRIDLGGIAKGFAVDRAIDALRESGCAGGLVNAGGDLAVFGDRVHDIVLRQPGGEAIVRLCNAALATSVIDGAAPPREHQGYYGGEVRAGSVAIQAPSAAVADALTKCVLMGREASNRELLEAFGARQVSM